MQDRDVLLLARDHMEDREPLHEAVLEFFQRLAKQHAAGRAVAVEQEKLAFGFARQHALGDRQDRRDAGARGEADMNPRLIGRMHDAEAAGRCHDIEFVAGLSVHRPPSSRTRRRRLSSPRCATRRRRDRSRSNRSGALPRRPWSCAGSDTARAQSGNRPRARWGSQTSATPRRRIRGAVVDGETMEARG